MPDKCMAGEKAYEMMLEKMKDAGYAMRTAGMIQNKVKALRQAYIRAKDAVNR